MLALTETRNLLRRVHDDERGSVSFETILVLAVIALPVLTFLVKFGWPLVRDYFLDGTDNLLDAPDEFSG